jgi:hypothetical protein
MIIRRRQIELHQGTVWTEPGFLLLRHGTHLSPGLEITTRAPWSPNGVRNASGSASSLGQPALALLSQDVKRVDAKNVSLADVAIAI